MNRRKFLTLLSIVPAIPPLAKLPAALPAAAPARTWLWPHEVLSHFQRKLGSGTVFIGPELMEAARLSAVAGAGSAAGYLKFQYAYTPTRRREDGTSVLPYVVAATALGRRQQLNPEWVDAPLETVFGSNRDGLYVVAPVRRCARAYTPGITRFTDENGWTWHSIPDGSPRARNIPLDGGVYEP